MFHQNHQKRPNAYLQASCWLVERVNWAFWLADGLTERTMPYCFHRPRPLMFAKTCYWFVHIQKFPNENDLFFLVKPMIIGDHPVVWFMMLINQALKGITQIITKKALIIHHTRSCVITMKINYSYFSASKWSRITVIRTLKESISNH